MCLFLQGYEGKNLIFSWVYGMSAFRFYHFFLMMYVLIWIGGHRISVSISSLSIIVSTLSDSAITLFWLYQHFLNVYDVNVVMYFESIYVYLVYHVHKIGHQTSSNIYDKKKTIFLQYPFNKMLTSRDILSISCSHFLL